MKKFLLILFVLMTTNAVAQEIEAVDSIDVETGVIYPANEVADTVSVDSLANASVPQIPIDQCDSLLLRTPNDRYGVVWKDGKCGVYDLAKEENVTRIEYGNLWYSFRKEMEGEYYTYFGWEEADKKGVIGVAEVNNQFITISMSKEEEN